MALSGDPDTYCLIGAGATGLAAARVLTDAGLPFDCFEREDDVGGVWRFDCPSGSVCDATHLISSTKQTEFADFPMPSSYPCYPNHRQVLEYLRSYAQHFGLYPRITFNTAVEQIQPADNGWKVTLSGGVVRQYAGVVVANGHLWEPNWPSYPGHFSGRSMHSRQVRYSRELVGQRVLVVGTGNSGCDIAVEAGRFASKAFHSVRNGRHFVPKFLFGTPSDSGADFLWRYGAPLWMHRLMAWWPLHVSLLDPVALGLPKPDHRLFSERVIPNDRYLSELAHGRFQIRPNIAGFDGPRVEFVDGHSEEIDLIIFATGYKLTIPFLDQQYLAIQDGVPNLYLNVFHPQFDNLFFVGLSEPSTKTWPVAVEVTRLITLFIKAHKRNPADTSWFRHLKSHNAGPVGWGSTPQARFLEVDYHDYLKRLRPLFKRFGSRLD